MKTIRIFCLAVALFSSNTFAANLTDYADHQALPDWSSTAFEALLKADVISGTDGGELKPNNTINRAEFLKILLNATDKDLIDPRPNTFTDVHPEHWFYQYVETAKSLAWVDGYADGTFKPGNTINRAEIAKLINKAFGITATTSKNDTNWYDGHVSALSNNNLLPYNVQTANFNAARTPTRAEAFEQIYRALQFKYTGKAAPVNATEVKTDDGGETGYDVAANFSLTMAVTPTAGRLDLKRPDSQSKKITVTPGQNNVTIAQIEVVAREGDVDLSGLQFRRIGNGSIADFGNLWLSANNQTGPKQKSSTDLITMSFGSPLKLKQNTITVINLNADIAAGAKIGGSERFVLYLPDWINANTNEKIGLFPLGGSDVEIK